MEDLNLKSFSRAEQNEILGQVRALILDRIQLTVLETLSEAEREELQKLHAEANDAAAREYLQRKIPNLPFLMETIALTVIKELKK